MILAIGLFTLWLLGAVALTGSKPNPPPLVTPPPAPREVAQDTSPEMYAFQLESSEEQLIQDTLDVLEEEL